MTMRKLLDMINRDFAYEVAHATTPILLKGGQVMGKSVGAKKQTTPSTAGPRGSCKQLIGRRVRSTRDVTTVGGLHYPAGSLGTVVQTWRGRFNILFDAERRNPADGPGGGRRTVNQMPRSSFEEVQ